MSSSKNPFQGSSESDKTMENIPLRDPVPFEDDYEPQHQYQEPSEEVERQLAARGPNASPDLRPQSSKDASNLKRKPVPAPLRRASMEVERKTGTVSKIAGKAKVVGGAWFSHLKKGEAPWMQWYCCNVANGVECDQLNHRLKKECKKCGHVVCDNCVKGKM